MPSKDHPLMHPAQLEALKKYIELEIEYAFCVEGGGRYGRTALRARMRVWRERLTELLTETPMSAFGLGKSEGENEDANLTASANDPDEESDQALEALDAEDEEDA